MGQGPQCIIFSALEDQRQNDGLNFRESSVKNQTFFVVELAFSLLVV